MHQIKYAYLYSFVLYFTGQYLEKKKIGPVKFGETPNLEVNPVEVKMSPMIFCLTESVKEMKDHAIDLHQLLLKTNQKLQYYIKGGYWKLDSLQNVWSTQEWSKQDKKSNTNSHPRLPVTTIQLSKKLIIPLQQ